MKISREARKTCKALFSMTLQDGRINPQRVSEITDAVVREKPRHYLQILKEYTRLIRLEINKTQATIDSAVELDPVEKHQIQSNLTAAFGENSAFTFRVHPELIGGLRIKYGSDVWDGSIRARLDSIRQTT
ncbi:MAG: FoF1 ATP synthase subunit delta [Chthoniobacterales bacterium]